MALLTGRDLSTMQLDLLTERSRKFYDGTYKWISCEGFLDEEGVYRDFDDTPDARPPTPLPTPLLSDDEEDDNIAHNSAPSVLFKTPAGLGHEETGEPARSPFSDISGMTDVSDPPSELQSPVQGGRREAKSTPAKAPKEEMSKPFGKHDNDQENEGAGKGSWTRSNRINGQGKPLQDSSQSSQNRSAGKGHTERESMVGDGLEAEDKPTVSKKRKATGNDVPVLPGKRGGGGGSAATRRWFDGTASGDWILIEQHKSASSQRA